MAKATKEEKQQATIRRIARDNMRLALSHSEAGDYAAALDAIAAGMVALQKLTPKAES